MRLLRTILIGVAVVLALAIGGAYLLPRQVIVERTALIDAPPEGVFPHVNSLRAFTEWSPWNDHDPDMQVSYSGPEAGVGNTMEWSSDHPQVGNGRQEIIASTENQEVLTTLDFGGMGAAAAWWTLAPEGDGTRVTWGLDADMGMNPAGRWMGLFLDRLVGPDYESGIARLQRIVEG